MAEDWQRCFNIILMGKKSWSARALEFLLERGHKILAVVGKDMHEEMDHAQGYLTGAAKAHGIPAVTEKELYRWAGDQNSCPFSLEDVDLVISYLFWGKVKNPLLTIPKIGAINFHPAPLPDLRGLGGYNAAILEGRPSYGVSVHHMSEEIDDGDIIEVREFDIDMEKETALSLERKSMVTMFSLFKSTIQRLEQGEPMPRIPQRPEDGKYIVRKTFEAMKYILPTDDIDLIQRRIRAFWYPPYEGAKVTIAGKDFTVIDQSLLAEISKLVHS